MKKMKRLVELGKAKGVPVKGGREAKRYELISIQIHADGKLISNLVTHFFRGNSLLHLPICDYADIDALECNQGSFSRRNFAAFQVAVVEEVMRDTEGRTLIIKAGGCIHLFQRSMNDASNHNEFYMYEKFGESVTPLACCFSGGPALRFTNFSEVIHKVFQILRSNLDRIQKENTEKLAYLMNQVVTGNLLHNDTMPIVIGYSGIKDYGILPPEARPDRTPAAPVAADDGIPEAPEPPV